MENYTVYMHILPKEVSGHKNDKYYIGITRSEPKVRWKSGYGYRKQLFGKAIKKYGWDKFEHKIIETGLSSEQAKNEEISLIEKYRSCDRQYGYNVTTGGDGVLPREIVEKMAMKISVANKGRKLSEETKRKIAEKHKGRKLTQEQRAKISKGHMGKKQSDETKAKLSAAGKTTERCENLRKISEKAYEKTRKRIKCVETQEEYNKSIKDAVAMTGISRCSIVRSCKYKDVRCGMHFVYCE